ncbi:HesB/YadR/YfhF family protein [Fictibacillus halophilus]|uniref:HesB/YadR/YfhF family protein n=1 Tax=Fictibacillus halophilus TaxID=1610490 RepID=UPI00362CE5E5
MKIHMSEETAGYIIKDLQAVEGKKIRFFVRLGGCSTVQDGFSLGINKDTPKHPAVVLGIQNHEFFIEEEDEWFFDQNDLTVSVKNDEIQFEFHNEMK